MNIQAPQTHAASARVLLEEAEAAPSVPSTFPKCFTQKNEPLFFNFALASSGTLVRVRVGHRGCMHAPRFPAAPGLLRAED